MSFKKVFFTSMVAIGVSSVVSSALATTQSLLIHNHTKLDSTCMINGIVCSNQFSGGVSKAGTDNNIPLSLVRLACGKESENCKADVFMTGNCSGPKIATAIFSVNTGIKSVAMDTSEYQISGSGFDITLAGGPALFANK